MPTSQVEEHHDRLIRLESDLTDVRVEIGVLQSKVEDGFSMLSDKLDVVTQLGERVSAIELRERVREQVAADRKDRRWTRFKVIGGIGSALVAIIGLVIKIALGS